MEIIGGKWVKNGGREARRLAVFGPLLGALSDRVHEDQSADENAEIIKAGMGVGAKALTGDFAGVGNDLVLGWHWRRMSL